METSIFLSNRSQAVRLPKAVALPENVKRLPSGEPVSLRRPENHGMNGLTETASAPILWITGNNPAYRKGSHSDAEVHAGYEYLYFHHKK